MARYLIIPLMLWSSALVGLSGCETSFEVFGETDKYYSIFGILDASADTQWVRVEGLQDSLLTDTKPLRAVVSTTHLSTGRRVVWKDSLFHFPRGASAYNVWTDEPMQPLETYLFEVARVDGATSQVSVTLPESFDDPFLNTSPFSLINLPVSGSVCATQFDMLFKMERIAALQITYRVPTRLNKELVHDVSYVLEAQRIDQGYFEVTVRWVADLLELEALERDVGISELLQLRSVDLLIASAGPDWPDNALSNETVSLPDAVTHIDNGFGFVGGVVSKRISIPLGDYRDVSCFQ